MWKNAVMIGAQMNSIKTLNIKHVHKLLSQLANHVNAINMHKVQLKCDPGVYMLM